MLQPWPASLASRQGLAVGRGHVGCAGNGVSECRHSCVFWVAAMGFSIADIGVFVVVEAKCEHSPWCLQSRGAPLALAAPARGRSFQLADGFPDPWPESHALATPLVRLVALPHLTVPLNCPRLLPNASSQYHVLVWVFWVT